MKGVLKDTDSALAGFGKKAGFAMAAGVGAVGWVVSAWRASVALIARSLRILLVLGDAISILLF